MKQCIYLFDWGDTIMKDYPDEKGAMCNWEKVDLMPNADKLLMALSQKSDCYLATNAKDSTKDDIIKALNRVGLDIYFKDIFCYRQLGVSKPSKEYFDLILEKLHVNRDDIIMVGDNIETDIYGVQKLGINTILYDPTNVHKEYTGRKVTDLLTILNI